MKLLDKTIAIYGAIGFSVAVSYFTLVATGVPVENLKIYFVSTTALFVALLSLFNYFGLLCVVLALLPFSLAFLNVEVGIITFSPYVLGITILVILSVVSLHIKKIKFGFNLTDFLIGLLCLEYLITTFLSENIIESGHLAFHAIFVPVVSYFVVKWMVRTETEYHKAMVFLIWGIIIFSIFAMFQFIVTKERVVLLGVEPIGVATFAITGFLVIAYSNLRKNWVGLPAMLVTLGALVASLSRLYLVSVALAPFFIRYIRKGRALHLMLLMIVLSLAATIFLSYNPDSVKPKSFDVRAESTIDRITSQDYWKRSLYTRAFHYREAIDNFLRHPIAGTGLYKGEKIVTRHNFHVAWLEYGGVIGYVLYVAIFLVHSRKISKVAINDKYSAVNFLIIFIILTNGLTNGFMHGFMPYMAFLLMGFNEVRLRLWLTQKIKS